MFESEVVITWEKETAMSGSERDIGRGEIGEGTAEKTEILQNQ